MKQKFDFDEIVKIEELGERETIDIEVSDDHLFLANGILTHNCGYYTADVDLSDIAESAAINQDADGIYALYENEGDRANGIMWAVGRKNRFGGILNKPIQFKSNRQTLKISDVSSTNSGAYSKIEDDLGDI